MIINKTIDIKKNAINNTLKNNIENNNMNLFQKRINSKKIKLLSIKYNINLKFEDKIDLIK